MNPAIKQLLDQKVKQYNHIDFIEKDPISIPHLFTKQQDIEIAAFFAAIFAWGNRTTIIQKSKELLERMDNAPFEFCTQHHRADLKKLIGFAHRTFKDTDLLYCIAFFKKHYASQKSLETAFFINQQSGKKINTVPFFKPFIYNFKCIWKRHYGNHSFGLFVRNIITDSSINID